MSIETTHMTMEPYVLVALADPRLRGAVASALADLGCDVAFAEGDNLVQALIGGPQPYSLLLLDVTLAGVLASMELVRPTLPVLLCGPRAAGPPPLEMLARAGVGFLHVGPQVDAPALFRAVLRLTARPESDSVDIPGPVAADERLREREERLSDALGATRAVTFESRAGSGLWSRSENSLDVLGLPSGGTTEEFLAIVHPEDLEFLRVSIERAHLEETRRDGTFRILHSCTGAMRWIHAQIQLHRDTTGRTARVTGVLTDITERRRAEARTQAFQREEAFGRLAGGVAHEVNNALVGVLGFASLALRELSPAEPVRKYVEQILRAGERGAQVTRQLLAFGRKQVLQARDVDIVGIVDQFEPMLRQALGPDKVLDIVREHGPALAHVDPGQIEQVLLNLVLNARDAMSYGGRLEIRVSLTGPRVWPESPGVPGGPWVCLTVADDGEGMDEVTQAHLFEPFFTTKPMGKGTGLGLPTVYGIVQQSQGRIAVTTAPGQGTTFRILLPQVIEVPVEQPKAAPRTGVAPNHRVNVLVVDDEPIVLDTMKSILELGGYNVVGACSVAEALSVLASPSTWDLVVSDLVMPRESGSTLADQLRVTHPELPLLFVSGYTGDEAIRRGLMPGGASFLQKPFTVHALLARAAELLGVGPR